MKIICIGPKNLWFLSYSLFLMYYIYGISGSSLRIESTDSMIESTDSMIQPVTVRLVLKCYYERTMKKMKCILHIYRYTYCFGVNLHELLS